MRVVRIFFVPRSRFFFVFVTTYTTYITYLPLSVKASIIMSGISMSSSDESIDSRGTIQNPAEEPKNLSNLHLQTDKSIDQFKANDVGYEPSPDTFSTDNDVECYPNGTDLHSDDGEQISYPPPADFGNLSPISRPSQDDLLNRTMNTVESSQSSLRRFTQVYESIPHNKIHF